MGWSAPAPYAPPMTHLATGTMLAGYRIERLLGQGGMGVVYLADAALARPPDRAQADLARALARGRLPGALPARVTPGRIDRPPEHRPGARGRRGGRRPLRRDALRRRLRPAGTAPRGRRAGTPRAARIAAQIGAALDAAHARGLVHRDVKPANILLADPGGAEHCYLTDFGLTKQTAASTALTQTGTVMGTVHYIAPEQLRGEAVDGRTDVYALGCVLYELLTGRPPFVRDTDVATLFAHLSQAPPSLEGPLDDVVQRALAKDPADRFQSAGELGRAAELGATQSGTIRVTAPVVPAVAEAPAAAAAPAGRAARGGRRGAGGGRGRGARAAARGGRAPGRSTRRPRRRPLHRNDVRGRRSGSRSRTRGGSPPSTFAAAA